VVFFYCEMSFDRRRRAKVTDLIDTEGVGQAPKRRKNYRVAPLASSSSSSSSFTRSAVGIDEGQVYSEDFDAPLEVADVVPRGTGHVTQPTPSMSAAAAQHVVDVREAEQIVGSSPTWVGEKKAKRSDEPVDLDRYDAEAHAVENLATLAHPDRKYFIHTRDYDIEDNQNCTCVTGLAQGTAQGQRIGRQVNWISVHCRGVIFPNYNAARLQAEPDRIDIYLIWDSGTSPIDIGAASFTSTGSYSFPLPELCNPNKFEVIAHRSYNMGAFNGVNVAGAVTFTGTGCPLRCVDIHKSLVGRKTTYKGNTWDLADIQNGVLWFVVVGFWDPPAGPGSEYWSCYVKVKMEYYD